MAMEIAVLPVSMLETAATETVRAEAPPVVGLVLLSERAGAVAISRLALVPSALPQEM
jgi:hypothetical protein